jgi:hypothetical protein
MKVVLLNVVVAVLLDSFGKGDGEDEDDDVVDEPTALSAAAMTTAPSPAPPATALAASDDEPQAVISAEAMTKLEKLLGKVDELGSLAKMVSEMQATVGLMKREVALMKTKPLIPRPEPQMLLPRHPNQARPESMMLKYPNPEASLDPPIKASKSGKAPRGHHRARTPSMKACMGACRVLIAAARAPRTTRPARRLPVAHRLRGHRHDALAEWSSNQEAGVKSLEMLVR